MTPKQVLFLRLPIDHAEHVTAELVKYYQQGYRVVSHAVAEHGEYSFVLERP